MSAQRTPAAHRDEPRKQNKGRPSKSDRVANIPEDAINRIQARRMLVENPLPRSQGDDLAGFYHDRISMGMEMDGQWDPEDDEAVDEEWDQFAQTAKLPDFAKSTRHGYLLTLFKVYLRLYQTTPIVLLSLYYQLRYQATSINGTGHGWVSPHGEGSRGTVGPSNSQFEDTASESELSTVSRQRSVLSSRLRPGGDGGSETGGTFDDNFEEEAESDSTPALWASARDEIHTSEALPQQPSTASPGESLQNSRVLSEISELRRENRELRDGQQRLYKLMEESQKRHNESMGSIQAQLRELIEANQASNL
ncbi:hypothetical protein FVER53590_06609 [Fusarium verticillioides]|nr:hypothetical protein FVER53590_06609 [Fusarium verticillioides]